MSNLILGASLQQRRSVNPSVPGAERLNMYWMYLPAVLFASVVKVWLPGLTGTISLSFVVLLAACSQLSFPEVVLLSVLAAIVQSFWRPQVRPGTVQVVFNAGVVVLGSASAYAIVGGWATRETAMALYARLGLAALAMYAVTTILVATVCCLVAQRPLRVLWQSFCFWTMPYYLVGAAFAGLIASAPNGRGSAVLLALPLLALIGVSYRIHLRRAEHISE